MHSFIVSKLLSLEINFESFDRFFICQKLLFSLHIFDKENKKKIKNVIKSQLFQSSWRTIPFLQLTFLHSSIKWLCAVQDSNLQFFIKEWFEKLSFSKKWETICEGIFTNWHLSRSHWYYLLVFALSNWYEPVLERLLN